MKEELRKKAIEMRKSLNIAQISREICQKICAMPIFIEAKSVGIFYPKEIEINLLSLCNLEDKDFFLPRTESNFMEFYKFEGEEFLEKGRFGILEPNLYSEKGLPDLIVVPALCADLRGFRLGWGKGFYDKYLKNYEGKIICPVPDCLIYDKIPDETHDICCDFVVSEKRIITIS